MFWWQNKPIIDLVEGYEKVSPREQKVLLAAVISVFSLILYMLAVEPLIISYQAMNTERKSVANANNKIKTQLEITLTKKYQDPNIPLHDELNALETKSLQLDEDISLLTKALVAPKQMVQLLEKMLKNDSQMKLLSLINLPKEDVTFSLEGPGAKKENSEGGEEGLIYKHAFEIEMKATYDSTVRYLQRIDKLPWKVFWQELDYEAGEYPNGNLKIKIYTLSTSQEVLGV